MSGSVILKKPEDRRAFQEPWQAEALATALSLEEAGVITASEWSQALGAAIKRAQAGGDRDDGETYYLHVLDALESLLRTKGLIEREELSRKKTAWEEAYLSTPHGQPVALPSTSEHHKAPTST